MALEDAVCLSHMLDAHPRSCTRAGALSFAAFSAHRARAVVIPRHRRAHLSSRRRTRPHPQRHHEREDVGGLLPRSGLALWRHRAGRLIFTSSRMCTAAVADARADDGSGFAERKRVHTHPQQRLAVDLAGAGLRQFVDEVDLARIFVGQQLGLDVILQPPGRVALIEPAVRSSRRRPSASYAGPAVRPRIRRIRAPRDDLRGKVRPPADKPIDRKF